MLIFEENKGSGHFELSIMYGIIGKKLSHSYSAILFEQQFGKKIPFQLIELEKINDLLNFIEENPTLKGFSVTIPYKKEILPFISELDEVAQACGSVNTVKINRLNNMKLIGYNTDVFGFSESYKNFIPASIKNALVLGTGGASTAVSFALKEMKIETTFVSHTKKSSDTISYSELTPDMISENKLIVNTTPLGMFPKINEYPEICFSAITKDHIIIDIIYNPDCTLFLQKAKIQHAEVHNGLEMLKNQAKKAWKIWGLT
jgi:shikimate dehydrogenase